MKELNFKIKEETNVSSHDKFLLSSYAGEGCYMNADENGIVEVVLVIDGSCWVFPVSITKLSTTKNEGKEQQHEEQNKVTENFALKMLATAMGSVKQIEL